jgi:hypothetical protein
MGHSTGAAGLSRTPQRTSARAQHQAVKGAAVPRGSPAWLTLHRPAAVCVRGEPAQEPRYRIFASAPEGQYDDKRRQAMVEQVTEAVLDAERAAYVRDPRRVCVFAFEVPEGTLGPHRSIARLADILGFVVGDADKRRELSERRLAHRTGVDAVA